MSSSPLPRRVAAPLASALATVTGNLYLLVGTVVFSTIALAVSWIPPGGRRFFGVARLWSRGLLWTCGVRLEAGGAERLDPATARVYMANHLSLLDIPVLIASLPGETRFLAKRSLFQIPLFGWALKAGGFITVDRGDRGRAQAGFLTALRRLGEGVSILVFPEGSRSRDGRLQPFKRGGLLLALRSGLPIVPVGIQGTLGLRRRGSLRIRPGTARVRYGEPVDPAEFGLRRRGELEQLLRRRISELAGLD